MSDLREDILAAAVEAWILGYRWDNTGAVRPGSKSTNPNASCDQVLKARGVRFDSRIGQRGLWRRYEEEAVRRARAVLGLTAPEGAA